MNNNVLWQLKRGNQVISFWVGESVCKDCGKQIMAGFYVQQYRIREIVHGYYCEKCTRHLERLNIRSCQIISCNVCVEPPAGSIPVAIQHPGWSVSRRDHSEMVSLEGEEVVDRTQAAGRDGYVLDGDAQIGLLPESVDNPGICVLSNELMIDELLDFHMNAKPVLEDNSDGKRLLE